MIVKKMLPCGLWLGLLASCPLVAALPKPYIVLYSVLEDESNKPFYEKMKAHVGSLKVRSRFDENTDAEKYEILVACEEDGFNNAAKRLGFNHWDRERFIVPQVEQIVNSYLKYRGVPYTIRIETGQGEIAKDQNGTIFGSTHGKIQFSDPAPTLNVTFVPARDPLAMALLLGGFFVIFYTIYQCRIFEYKPKKKKPMERRKLLGYLDPMP